MLAFLPAMTAQCRVPERGHTGCIGKSRGLGADCSNKRLRILPHSPTALRKPFYDQSLQLRIAACVRRNN